MSRLLRRQRGFTLIELLIVIAIIGIIAAILIPNFLDSLQKAKQKRTMGDMKDSGTAWFAWLTDQAGGAAAAGATTVTLPAAYAYADLQDDLEPDASLAPPFAGYIQKVPQKDGWNHDYIFCRAANVLTASPAMAIVSTGRNGPPATAGCGGTPTVGTFEPTDYDQDLVWVDGYFVRFPQKQAAGGGT